MNQSRFLQSRAIWTIGSYGASTALRLGTNIALSRLLAPEIFGIMVIVNSIKIGIELLTDVGIEQNIVHNKAGVEDQFFNTAWTVQIARGVCLTALFLCLSPLLTWIYPVDVRVFLIISFAPLINSLASTSIFALVKNLDVKRRNLFELNSDFIAFVIYVSVALITPTVWAPLIAALLSLGARAALSYSIPHPPHRLLLHRSHLREILGFGRWIFISSFVVYGTNNLDRIYLGRVAPLGILGIYGIARTITELPSALANRLSYQIVFPFLVATRTDDLREGHTELAPIRWKCVLLASVIMGTSAGWADWAIKIIYDPRYREAGWMLFVLMLGAWFSVLSSLNEAVILGSGRPAYNSLANGARLAFLTFTIPVAYLYAGFQGAVIAISSSEICRLSVNIFAQHKVRSSFWRQDLAATAVLIVVLVGWIFLRQALSLGEPWDRMFS